MRLLAGLCALASVLSVANAGMMDDNRPAPQMGGVGVEQPEGVHTRMNVKVNIRAVIQRILSRYPARYAMFREMIQNANDAGASMIKFEFRASCDPDGDSLWSSLKGRTAGALARRSPPMAAPRASRTPMATVPQVAGGYRCVALCR